MMPPELRALVESELSSRARAGYVVLLLVASMMTTLVLALLVTESGLPARTQGALTAIVVLGAGWASLAAWRLRSRHILLGRDRVLAGRLAVMATGIFTAGCAASWLSLRSELALFASLSGVVMLAVAATMLARANRRFAQLSARRAALELQLQERQRS